MSTYREAQSRSVGEIEEIVEIAVAKLDAKRAPKERNQVSFSVNRAKVLPKFDLEVVTVLGFVVEALHTKIRKPQVWLQHSLDALGPLNGPCPSGEHHLAVGRLSWCELWDAKRRTSRLSWTKPKVQGREVRMGGTLV